MAPNDSASPLGVVDSQCRVYGVDKLRVIGKSLSFSEAEDTT
jgi:hypothetical protein